MEKAIPSTQDARLDQIQQMEKAINLGVAGICMLGSRPQEVGGPAGDFVEHRFLCDRWSGRQGSSVATAGHPIDKLNEELHEIAEDRANKK